MVIDIIDESNFLQADQVAMIQGVIELAAQKLDLGQAIELDLSFVDNDEIQRLNREFRQIDKVTDVLSFALEEVVSEFDLDYQSDEIEESLNENDLTAEVVEDDEELIELDRHLGDIIISVPRAQEQALDYGHSFERELAFLAVHGFLHLNGYDHQTEDEAKEMFALQEEVLTEYGISREKL
ncbi:rRNA maturation RNase YbeY [Vaginisenegalia massiliensis]|uniref:rRNA maturation RNase YbeY n=1 Tax=Vaginisenegalia massiliensis TaxID=2058294 RepID=UPI000F541DD7|nr:rRNA maturation RNase YbeY [Vaginisenegalia massiliensis]